MNGSDGWRTATSHPALASDEVHLWRVWLTPPDDQVPQLARHLSPEELEKADRFHFPRDRLAYLVSHGVLRLLLGRYLGAAPAEIEFSYNAKGKPACRSSGDLPDVCFNLSHSGQLALYAVARARQVGVDVERNRQLSDMRQLAKSCFSEREFQVLESVSSDQREQAFFNCWTRKEAYIKGRGEGLSHPLQDFDVTLAPGDAAALLADRTDPLAAARWRLKELAPGPGYTAAVAVEGDDWQVRCWQW